MREASNAEIEAGQNVKVHQDAVDKAQGRLNSNQTMIADMRAKKEKLNTEAELLNSKDNLGTELKHRLLDIESNTAVLERNIENLSSDHQNLNHAIDMATVDLQSARQSYADVTAPPSVTGQLTQQDILTLQTSKPRTKQTHQEQVDMINRYGREAYNEYVPMI